MKNISTKITLIFVIPLLLVTCNKDDENADFMVYADVYVISKLIDGIPKDATAMYVMGNRNLEAVQVIPPGNTGNTIQLQPDAASGQTFSFEPEEQDFLSGIPDYGNYLFVIEGPGNEVVEQTDVLQPVNLEIPQIVSTSFNSNTRTLSVMWNAASNADGIIIKLVERQMHDIYSSFILAPATTEFNISTADGHWNTSVSIGDSLTLQVQGFKIETNADINNSLYNVEKIAVGEAMIMWGEN